MDIENELRQAMAEHVDDVSAPVSLAAAARRGYRRKVRVRAAVVSAAAVAVAVVAAMPVYQAVRAEPVGAEKGTPRHPAAGATAPSAPTPVMAPAKPSARPRATPTAPPAPPAPSSAKGHRHRGGSGGRSLLSYLPPGLRQSSPCKSADSGGRVITMCRWTGSGGLVEVRLVRGEALGDPADLGYMPPVPTMVRVHDQPAVRGAWPDYGSQVSWIERPGLGVWVGVGPTLNDKLMRIAEGVRVPS